jgi:hypothetical protein
VLIDMIDKRQLPLDAYTGTVMVVTLPEISSSVDGKVFCKGFCGNHNALTYTRSPACPVRVKYGLVGATSRWGWFSTGQPAGLLVWGC